MNRHDKMILCLQAHIIYISTCMTGHATQSVYETVLLKLTHEVRSEIEKYNCYQ